MCGTAGARIMGCGKSRHHSPDASENDLKSQGSLKKESKQSFNKNPKKKKRANETDTKGETSQSTKKETNGKNKFRDGPNNSSGTSSGVSTSSSRSAASSSSSSSPLQHDSEKSSNGATKSQGNYYLLEVPNEIYTATTAKEASTRPTSKEIKTAQKSAKCVHATTSQLEFFKMLDEKIEMGDNYEMSNEAPLTSKVSEASKH